MSDDLVLQGTGAEFDKPFVHGDKIMILRSSCLDKSMRSTSDVKLLLEHDEKQCVGSTSNKRLLIHAGKKHLVFRFFLPSYFKAELLEIADDYNSYFPVSIGYKYLATESENIDGVKVMSVVEAELQEISLLSKPPAISSTYARIVSLETCNALHEDYDMGRFELVGKYVSLHRKVAALDNGGVVKYSHRTSPYDRAADNFQNALRKLGQ